MLLLPFPALTDKAQRSRRALTVFLPGTGFMPTSRIVALGSTTTSRHELPRPIPASAVTRVEVAPAPNPVAPKPAGGPTLQVTELRVPSAYWQCRGQQPERAQAMIGGAEFTVHQVPGVGWRIARVVSAQERIAGARTLPPAPALAASTPVLDAFARARLHHPTPSYPRVRGLIRMSDKQAWDTPVHFGRNMGMWFRDLSEASREWYFDTWFAEREKNPDLLQRSDLPLYSALHHLVRGDDRKDHAVNPQRNPAADA